MGSFTDLNQLFDETLEADDLRNPGIETDVLIAPDIDLVETGGLVLDFQTGINIIDIIRPDDADVKLIIDLTSVSGTTASWAGTQPETVTITEFPLGKYTITLNSVSDWEFAKTAKITMPEDFQGSFFYTAGFEYTTNEGTLFQEWTVGTFIPVSQFILESSFEVEINVIRIPEAVLQLVASVDATIGSIKQFESSISVTSSIDVGSNYIAANASLQAGSFALFAAPTATFRPVIDANSAFTDDFAVNYTAFFVPTEFASNFEIPFNNGGYLIEPDAAEFAAQFNQADIDGSTARIRFGVIDAVSAITQITDADKFFGLIDEYTGVFTQQADTLNSRIRNPGTVDYPVTATMTVDLTESPMTLRVEVADGESIYFSLYNATDTFNINWGDGNSDLNLTKNYLAAGEILYSTPSLNTVTHTYATAGTYFVEIECASAFHFYLPSDKITAVQSFPYVQLDRVEHTFEGARDLVTIPDHPFTIIPSGSSAQEMFAGCNNFNSPLNNFPAEKFTNIGAMFRSCFRFNQNLNNWDVSNVTSMGVLFNECLDFNQPLNNWNTANVTSMAFMFNSATSFNQDISNWNTANVTDMRSMFAGTPYNYQLNNWDVSNVTNMRSMFTYATAFNQPLNNWNTANVTDMTNMFNNAIVFDQDISSWCVELIPVKPDTFDLNTPATWIEAEKPNWGVAC